MTGLKYQPSKASEAYYQIWLFFFYPFAKIMTTDFFLWGMGSVGNFACLVMDIIPIVVEYFGKVKHRSDIDAKMTPLCIC